MWKKSQRHATYFEIIQNAASDFLPQHSTHHMLSKLDTLGIEPKPFHMRSGCDATTPCAQVIGMNLQIAL